MSSFTNRATSSWLVDCPPLKGGPDGRRGQGHHECAGARAGACDSPSHGEEAHAGVGGRASRADRSPCPSSHPADLAGGRPEAGASQAGEAVEPADPGEGQSQAADAEQKKGVRSLLSPDPSMFPRSGLPSASTRRTIQSSTMIRSAGTCRSASSLIRLSSRACTSASEQNARPGERELVH